LFPSKECCCPNKHAGTDMECGVVCVEVTGDSLSRDAAVGEAGVVPQRRLVLPPTSMLAQMRRRSLRRSNWRFVVGRRRRQGVRSYSAANILAVPNKHTGTDMECGVVCVEVTGDSKQLRQSNSNKDADTDVEEVASKPPEIHCRETALSRKQELFRSEGEDSCSQHAC
jgi:hypothetical protein